MARNRRPMPPYEWDDKWHLKRDVPLALLLGLLLQVVAFVWWISGLSHDVAQVKSNIVELTADAKIKATAINQIIELKTEQRYIREALERLERAVADLTRPQPRIIPYRTPKVAPQ